MSGNIDHLQDLTESARRAFAYAREEAEGYAHPYIGAEHILLGILRVNDSVAGQALLTLGVTLEQVRNAVEQVTGRGTQPVQGQPGLTMRSRQVLELAIDEAHRRGRRFASTGHLLLGVLAEGENVAARILVSLGVDLDRAGEAVGASTAEESPAEDQGPDATG